MNYPTSVYAVFHPDPFHIHTRLELEAFQVAARHHWAIQAIMVGPNLRWPAGPNRQLEQHAYPGQPSTTPHAPVQPCTCSYWYLCCGVQPGPHSSQYLHPATGFEIDPRCPHHGDGDPTRDMRVLVIAAPGWL